MITGLLKSGFRLAQTKDKQLIRGLCWSVAEGLFSALTYLCLYCLLYSTFTKQLNITSIALYGTAMALTFFLRIIAGCIGAPLIYNGAFAMMGEARLRMADHLRKLPLGWFDKQRGGDLAARLTSDLSLVEQVWSHFLQPLVYGLAMPSFLLMLLFCINWPLALLMIAGFPFALMTLLWTQYLFSKAGADLQTANTNAQSALLEYVQSIAVIRSFGRFGKTFRKLENILSEQHKAALKVETKTAPFLALFGLVLEIGYISLIPFGAYLFLNGEVTSANLLIFLILALPIYRQLFELGLSTIMLRFANASLTRIEDVMNVTVMAEPAIPELPGKLDIVFENVSFAYNLTHGGALKNISCTIAPHQLTAIVGPSGAGKSTFVHLIARLWDVDGGTIRLGGINIKEIGTENLHQHIGMVFQDVLLFSGSVLDNLRIGKADASREEIIDAAKRAEAHSFIAALPSGYDTILDENGSSLSGGERQRLSIARALLKDAPILLLDEATANLDPSSEALVQKAITQLARNRTVIIIAHRLNAVRHADKIVVLDEGHLIEQGTHSSLLKQDGLYKRLWNKQQNFYID